MTTSDPLYSNLTALPYLLTAVMASWAVYSMPWHRVSGWAERASMFVGNHTLTILTWHFLVFKLVSILIVRCHNLPIERLAEFPVIKDWAHAGWWAAYFAAGMAVTCAIARANRFIKSHWLKL